VKAEVFECGANLTEAEPIRPAALKIEIEDHVATEGDQFAGDGELVAVGFDPLLDRKSVV